MALLEINKSVNVNTSEECFKFYKAFCRSEQNTSNYAVFRKLSNLYVLCASIGYHLGIRTQLINPVRCTRSEHISITEEMPTLIAIAYADPNEGHDLSLFGDIKKILNYELIVSDETSKKYKERYRLEDDINMCLNVFNKNIHLHILF